MHSAQCTSVLDQLSCGLAFVVFQQPAEPLTPLHRAFKRLLKSGGLGWIKAITAMSQGQRIIYFQALRARHWTP
jgi:hypothetical protein